MTATIILAFLHHAAAFVLVGALMTELVLLRNELTVASARSVLRMDAAYGVAAIVLLVVGLLRVFYTEKGAAYYFASGSFLTKLTLFLIVGLLSIFAGFQGTAYYLDAALVIALLGFVGTLAAARYHGDGTVFS